MSLNKHVHKFFLETWDLPYIHRKFKECIRSGVVVKCSQMDIYPYGLSSKNQYDKLDFVMTY